MPLDNKKVVFYLTLPRKRRGQRNDKKNNEKTDGNRSDLCHDG